MIPCRLWLDKRVSMASTVRHERTEVVMVQQAEDDLFGAFSERYKQFGRMDESFSLEDAVRAAVIKAYEADGYYVVPIDYTLVFGHTGKAI